VGVGGALTGHAGLGPRLGLACMHSPEIVCFFVMSNQYSARCCSHAAPPGPNTPASHRDITLSDQACTHNPTGSQPSYKSFYSLRLSLGAYKVMYVTTPPPHPPPTTTLIALPTLCSHTGTSLSWTRPAPTTPLAHSPHTVSWPLWEMPPCGCCFVNTPSRRMAALRTPSGDWELISP
jgi:hypothetical protein